jgi:hypothetical protein
LNRLRGNLPVPEQGTLRRAPAPTHLNRANKGHPERSGSQPWPERSHGARSQSSSVRPARLRHRRSPGRLEARGRWSRWRPLPPQPNPAQPPARKRVQHVWSPAWPLQPMDWVASVEVVTVRAASFPTAVRPSRSPDALPSRTPCLSARAGADAVAVLVVSLTRPSRAEPGGSEPERRLTSHHIWLSWVGVTIALASDGDIVPVLSLRQLLAETLQG